MTEEERKKAEADARAMDDLARALSQIGKRR